jgi:hypothetical protein
VFFVLSLSTIEFAPVIGVFVAVYGFILLAKRQLPRTKRTNIYLFVAALISVGFLILGITVKELLNPTTSAVPTPFHYLFSNPSDIFNVLSVQLDLKFKYLIYLFGPVAFLPFLAPEALVMALPWLSLSFLSSYNPYYSIFYFYSGFVIPFIFVALPKAISRFDSSKINGFYRSNKKKLVALLTLSTLVFSIYLPIVPDPTKSWNFTFPLNSPRNELIEQMLSLVPSNASILTQNDIFPHVSSRAEAYLYLNFSEVSVDYILVDTGSEWYRWIQPEQFGTRIPLREYVENATENGTYGQYATATYAPKQYIILFKKDYSGKLPIIGEPVNLDAYSLSFNFEHELRLENGSVVQDPSSASGFVMNSGVDDSGVLWFGPYIDLNPGLYKVTYVLKVNDATPPQPSDLLFTVDVTHSSGQVLDANKHVYGLNFSSNGGQYPIGQWFSLTLEFGLSEIKHNVEFRGLGVDDHNVSLDYIVVDQISQQPSLVSEFAFNYKTFIVKAGKVINGVLIHEAGSGSGVFWSGPYASLPKGNYTARFWLRLDDDSYEGSVLNLSVNDINNNTLLASQTVRSSDFKKQNEWQSFEVPFEVPFETLSIDMTEAEFSGVKIESSAPVSLLFIEVFSNTGDLFS